MRRFLLSFLRADQGATAIEYAIMAAFIAAVVAGALAVIGTRATGVYDRAGQIFN